MIAESIALARRLAKLIVEPEANAEDSPLIFTYFTLSDANTKQVYKMGQIELIYWYLKEQHKHISFRDYHLTCARKKNYTEVLEKLINIIHEETLWKKLSKK